MITDIFEFIVDYTFRVQTTFEIPPSMKRIGTIYPLTLLNSPVFVIVLVFCFAFEASGQRDVHLISLQDFSIFADSIPFGVKDIIDARKGGNAIGFVQRGISNKKKLAIFARPGLEEVFDLFARSNVIDKESKVVVRVARIYVSELARNMQEFARAEVALDFFVERNGLYYFIATEYGASEDSGFETTYTHPGNIADAFRIALNAFWARLNISETDSFGYGLEELQDRDIIFQTSDSLPILSDTIYRAGLYKTFDEFVNNTPSLPMTCKVKIEEERAIIKCKDDQQEQAIESVFGFAFNNMLYIRFLENFYRLEKKGKKFYFKGPKAKGNPSNATMTTGAVLGGAIGGMIVSSTAWHSTLYELDPVSGTIRPVTGI
jgi:hypothetical protein